MHTPDSDDPHHAERLARTRATPFADAEAYTVSTRGPFTFASRPAALHNLPKHGGRLRQWNKQLHRAVAAGTAFTGAAVENALREALTRRLGPDFDYETIRPRLVAETFPNVTTYLLDGLPILRIERIQDEIIVEHLTPTGRVAP